MSAQARKAWNQTMLEAMKSTGQKLKPANNSNAAPLPGINLVPSAATTRSSDRHKRREKARKSTTGTYDLNTMIDIRIDALEGIVGDGSKLEEEDEYTNIEEDKDSGNTAGKRKRSTFRGPSRVKKGGADPKRLKARSLASILLEESSRSSNVISNYLEAEARPMTKDRKLHVTRNFCSVTGLFGIYKDPKSGIPYTNLRALEQIRERAPPWMVLSGNAAYADAIRSLRNEDEE